MNEHLMRVVGISTFAFAMALSAGAQTPHQSSNSAGESSPDTTKTEQGADVKSHRSDDAGAAKDSPPSDSGDDGMGEMHEKGRMDQDGASGAADTPASTKRNDR